MPQENSARNQDGNGNQDGNRDGGGEAQHARDAQEDRGDGHGYDYDVLVVGSGFGGSVSALRLTEKGYRVGVLEAGRRFTRQTLPKNSWDLRNYLWAPALGCYGIQRVHLLGNVMVLAGAGVGGGSLNYANTLYVPRSSSSRTASGATSRTGRRSWPPTTTRPSGCWGSASIRR